MDKIIKVGIADILRFDTNVYTILQDIETGECEIKNWGSNLITNAGKQAILRRLQDAGSQSNEGMITYGAVGTGSGVVPAVGDTTLDTELDRAVLSYTSLTDQTLELRVYYNKTEANGTITEFAWFGEGASASSDSGTMFNHINLSVTKDSAKTLTVVQSITIT